MEEISVISNNGHHLIGITIESQSTVLIYRLKIIGGNIGIVSFIFISQNLITIRSIIKSTVTKNSLQGCICEFEKVREIPHLTQKTAGFWNICAGFSVLPEKTIFLIETSFCHVFIQSGIIAGRLVSSHYRINIFISNMT